MLNNDHWAAVSISFWGCNSSGPIKAGNLSSSLCLMWEVMETEGNDHTMYSPVYL